MQRLPAGKKSCSFIGRTLTLAETSDRIATSAYRAKKQLAEATGDKSAVEDDVNPHVPGMYLSLQHKAQY